MNNVYRFQLKRRAGWAKPRDGIGCSRPGPWGNPYIVGQPCPEKALAFATEAVGTIVAATGQFSRSIASGLIPDRLDYPWAVALFEADLLAGPREGIVGFPVSHVQTHLSDRPLGCWCPERARCHCEALARAANNMPPEWRPDFIEGPPWPT